MQHVTPFFFILIFLLTIKRHSQPRTLNPYLRRSNTTFGQLLTSWMIIHWMTIILLSFYKLLKPFWWSFKTASNESGNISFNGSSPTWLVPCSLHVDGPDTERHEAVVLKLHCSPGSELELGASLYGSGPCGGMSMSC